MGRNKLTNPKLAIGANSDVLTLQLSTNLGQATGEHHTYSIPFNEHTTFPKLNGSSSDVVSHLAHAYRDRLRSTSGSEWAEDSILKSIMGDGYQVDQNYNMNLTGSDVSYLASSMRDQRFNELCMNGGPAIINQFNTICHTLHNSGYVDIRDYVKASLLIKYGDRKMNGGTADLLIADITKDQNGNISQEGIDILTKLTLVNAESVENWRLDSGQTNLISLSRLLLADVMQSTPGVAYLKYLKELSQKWDTHDMSQYDVKSLYNNDATLDIMNQYGNVHHISNLDCTHTQYVAIVGKLLSYLSNDSNLMNGLISNGILNQTEANILAHGQRSDRLLKSTVTMANLSDSVGDLTDMVDKFSLVIRNTNSAMQEAVNAFGSAKDVYGITYAEKVLSNAYSTISGMSQEDINKELMLRGCRPLGSDLNTNPITLINDSVLGYQSIDLIPQVSNNPVSSLDIYNKLLSIGYNLHSNLTGQSDNGYIDYVLKNFYNNTYTSISENSLPWYTMNLSMAHHLGLNLDDNPIVFPMLNVLVMDGCLKIADKYSQVADINTILAMATNFMDSMYDINNSYLHMRNEDVHNLASTIGQVFNALNIITGYKSKVDGSFDSQLMYDQIKYKELVFNGTDRVSHLHNGVMMTGVSQASLLGLYLSNNKAFSEKFPSLMDCVRRPIFSNQPPMVSTALRNFFINNSNMNFATGAYLTAGHVAENIWSSIYGQANHTTNTPETTKDYQAFMRDPQVLDYCGEIAGVFNTMQNIMNEVSYMKCVENPNGGVAMTRGEIIKRVLNGTFSHDYLQVL